jgi:Fe-S-cluster formation regulator IscX/YfhJ
MKIHSVAAELFQANGRMDGRTDGQTDIMKLIVAFSNFVNAPKNSIYFSLSLQVSA